MDEKTLPHVSVEGIGGTTGTGRADLSPTSEGVPGPVPMEVELPGPGCWRVVAEGSEGTAHIVLKAT
nr:hypothetical protein [Streptomyces sp. S1D4-11]QIY99193.1 hypothetical protein HEP87_41195 [Streptomyces sp. S1D4-11]